jgi:hypothetical protein
VAHGSWLMAKAQLMTTNNVQFLICSFQSPSGFMV